VRRREFILGLGGAAAWPLAAQAQPADGTQRVARVAVLIAADGQVRVQAVRDQLARLGWIEGRNLKLEYRLPLANSDQIISAVNELIALRPEVIVAGGTAAVADFQRVTNSIPIVFATVADPVGAGFVTSLAQPGGNITGFLSFESSITGKWIQLLKELSPQVTRAVAAYNPETTAASYFSGPFREFAHGLQLVPSTMEIHNSAEIEPAIERVAVESGGGAIFLPSPFVFDNRKAIASAAIKYGLPIISPFRESTVAGGLASYGSDQLGQYREAANYVDRILKGEKPADLPVQTPTKFDLVINLKTAKALGLTVPSTLLTRADEVIE
jgi:putative ABC transport system substrate-binding protein